MVKIVVDKYPLSHAVWIREDVLRWRARAFEKHLEKHGNGHQEGPSMVCYPPEERGNIVQ
jgi:hypothetical protein